MYVCMYISAKIKIGFISKDDFFTKIGIFCKSIEGPLPSLVQAYTQPYPFGERIKLIINQIRHKLNVTIHEISTSWKKTLDGGPYSYLIKKKNTFEWNFRIMGQGYQISKQFFLLICDNTYILSLFITSPLFTN